MPTEGQTATGPNGQRAVFTGGRWVVQGGAQMPANPEYPYAGAKAAAQAINAQTDASVNQATRNAQIRKAEADARNAEGAEARARAAEARAMAAMQREAEASQRAADKATAEKAALEARGGVDTTENERTAAFLATRVAAGINTLGEIGENGAPSYFTAIAGGSGLGNYLTPPQWQRVFSAQMDILDSALTLGTGAAYTREQLEGYRKSYFPQPGDQPDVIADKRERLNVLLQSARVKSGAAAPLIDTALAKSGFNPAQPNPPAAPGLASADATEKSIPIPAQMQAEHAAYLQQNWGRIDPNGYAAFRTGLDEKYGFGPRPDVYREFAPTLNRAAQAGQSPSGMNIPAVNADMAGMDKLNASLFNNSLGAAVLGAGSLGGAADEVAGGVRSVLNGTDYATERDLANAMRGAAADAYPGFTIGGQIVGAGLTGYGAGRYLPGMAIDSLRKAIGVGSAYGAVSGALESNSDRAGGAMLGAAAGGIGGAVGQKVLAPAVEAATRRFSRTLPSATPGQATLGNMTGDIDNVRANLTMARDLNMPYSLADADPRLRSLAGTVARKSVDARALAETIFEPRARGQADRAVDAIDRYLAPKTDIRARSSEILEGGKPVYSPLYEQAYGAAPITSDGIETLLQTPAGRQATIRANTIAANERRDPTAMGFAVDGGGNVVLNPPPVAQMDALQSAREAWDQASKALSDASARKQATLVPTRAHMDEVKKAEEALKKASNDLDLAKNGLLQVPRGGSVQDARAYTTQSLDYVKRGLDDILEQSRDPVTNRLILDENGRAINSVKNDLIGEIDALNPTYGQARAAYGKFAKQAEGLDTGYKMAGAMPKRDFGTILSGAREYDASLQPAWAGQATVPEMQRGYATRMIDQVEDARLSANPYERVYGSTSQQAKAGQMFPQGAGRFGQVYDMEREMAKTAHETLGGSPTAQRIQADAQLGDALGTSLELGADVLSGGGFSGMKGLLSQNARQFAGDALRMGVGKRATAKANEIAPVLYSTNPEEALKALDAFALRRAAINDRRNAASRYGGLFGASLFSGLAVPST